MSRLSNLFILVPGWVLLLYLIVAQGIPAINYELGISMGTQEPAAIVTEVGVAFWRGFAVADLIVYIPLLLIGLLGYGRKSRWARLPLSAALGITVYWPVICLVAIQSAKTAKGWELPPQQTTLYWIVLSLISLWAAIALIILWGEQINP